MRFPRIFKKQAQSSTPAQTVSEIHWREGDATPAANDAASSSAEATRQAGPMPPHIPTRKAQTVSEIHWRQGKDNPARS